MFGEYLLFFILALAAVGAGLGMLISRNAVYAALFLIVNFASVAVLYLTLAAPFIALAQITVYGGAIMVLFLFVIMLLGAEKLPIGVSMPWQRPLGIVLGALLLVEVGYMILFKAGLPSGLTIPGADYASPKAIGLELFNSYLLPFEITSVLLLVALVGAIVLTKTERKPGDQRVSVASQAASLQFVEAQQPDILSYEKEIEEGEKAGEYSGPGPEDLQHPTL
jgi:NADH-quinone oxidoreductase subunit J